MSWGKQLYEEMELAVFHFGVKMVVAGLVVGIIVGIAIGWWLFGGGA